MYIPIWKVVFISEMKTIVSNARPRYETSYKTRVSRGIIDKEGKVGRGEGEKGGS